MFRPVALYIGLRYTRAKRRNHFISFISFTSMVGIALGVAVLITVLSVMNGFDGAIRHHFFSMAQQVSVRTVNGSMPQQSWMSLTESLSRYPGVTGVAPFIEGQGLLNANGQSNATLVYGILPSRETLVSALSTAMTKGKLTDLIPGHFGMIIGAKLADNLGVSVGDKVNLIVPTATLTPVGIFPRAKVFTVVGIFKAGRGFGYDSQLAFIQLNDAQKLLVLGHSVSGLQLKMDDMYKAPLVSQKLNQTLPEGYVSSDWTQSYGALFQAVKLEKTMMFLMLILIVAVAAFNLVSTLVMMVTDKKSDIAILRTLGATPSTILGIFMVQGTVIGIVGTLLGLLGGVMLALHVTDLVNFVEQFFHVTLISSDIYYVNYLPSELHWQDVWQVCLVALGLSLVATLYPAFRAARTEPAEALRYE